jgi:hypothetical protein
MALSEDQKAMLRLLAQREQGYEDLAALMGLSVDEVRVKVKDALDQLEAQGESAPDLPPEPARAEEPAPVAPKPSAAVAPAAEPAPSGEPAPRVEEPAAAEAPTAPATKAPARPKSPSSRPRPSLPKGTGARAALGAGLLVLIALVVVLAVSGGGDSADKTTASSGAGAVEEAIDANAASGGKEVTQAVLDPVDGGDAKGIAVFGRIKNSLALQIEASGLEPTGKGESYTVWLYESPQKMLPLASTRIGSNGKLAARVEVPTEVLGYLANETFDQIDISKTADATLKASLAKATQEKKVPVYTGTDVLRGRITGPIIGAAEKQSGE